MDYPPYSSTAPVAAAVDALLAFVPPEERDVLRAALTLVREFAACEAGIRNQPVWPVELNVECGRHVDDLTLVLFPWQTVLTHRDSTNRVHRHVGRGQDLRSAVRDLYQQVRPYVERQAHGLATELRAMPRDASQVTALVARLGAALRSDAERPAGAAPSISARRTL